MGGIKGGGSGRYARYSAAAILVLGIALCAVGSASPEEEM
jgi:hypothetical protein